MSDEQFVELARRADDAARGVDGVVRLYSATPMPARLARRITRPDEDAPLAVVERLDEQLTVTVSIGVSARRAASTTARRVADAVRAELGEQGPSEVRVRVSRVTEE